MIVRPGTINDIDEAKDLLQEFYDESLKEFGTQINLECIRDFLLKYVNYSFILENDHKIVGVISGMVSCYPLDGEKIYQEAVWFVSKPYRRWGLKLLHALEHRCNNGWGIKYIVMAHMANKESEKIGKFYKRAGYNPLEVHYIKTIGGKNDSSAQQKI